MILKLRAEYRSDPELYKLDNIAIFRNSSIPEYVAITAANLKTDEPCKHYALRVVVGVDENVFIEQINGDSVLHFPLGACENRFIKLFPDKTYVMCMAFGKYMFSCDTYNRRMLTITEH